MLQRSIILLSLVLIPVFGLKAQMKGANISFDFETHDFGKFKEAEGPVTVNFTFSNTGSTPLMIKQVRASCGCTSPNWSQEPILPGKKGFVSATYNPKNRPGPFSKTISVTSNAAGAPTKILTIKGSVIPKPKTLADVYRYNMSNKIRLKTNHMSFARVAKGTTAQKDVEIVNVSDHPVRISFDRVPAHLSLEAQPAVLPPQGKGVIRGTYDSQKKSDWGFVIDRINVVLDDQSTAANRLTISATLEEDFSQLSAEQRANAPVINFETNTFNFAEIKQGEKVEYDFTIRNQGKSDLIIRKVKASCGCTAVKPQDEVIAAGESTKMKVIFNSVGKAGKQNKTITVISNDPAHPRSILWVKGTVVKTNP